MERRYGVDPELALRVAECDGGDATIGSDGITLGSRESFRGRLTGVYFEEGDPPWRWYELADLTLKPEWHLDDTVWCEEGFIWVMDDPLPSVQEKPYTGPSQFAGDRPQL